MRRVRVACLFVLVFTIACAEPPEKEIAEAQNAIAAARAAGAEHYAPSEWKAASETLARAQAAVDQRDYRLALNYALDSRELAQNAARAAASQKAVVRAEAEKLLNETALALVQANSRLKQAENSRTAKGLLAGPRARIHNAEGAVQKARTALDQGDYLTAIEILREASRETRAASQELNAARAGSPPPRRN
jgi:Domain of unknown function (DUF4398)